MELISRMIQNTRNRLENHAGRPFLVWGYTTVGIALLNYWFNIAEAPVCSRMKTKSASSTPRRIDITARRSSECSRGFSSLNIFCAIGS